MISVTCDSCDLKMKLNYSPKGGEKIMVKCKGEDCENILTVSFPKKEPQSKPTVIMGPEKLQEDTPVIQVQYQTDTMSFPLSQGINIIGRKDYDKHPDISLNVTDKSVSRLHCIVDGIEDVSGIRNYVLQDYLSKNGVYFNGKKLSKYDQVYLNHNDEIYLSKTRLTFKTNLK